MSDGPLMSERYAASLGLDEYRRQLSARLDQLGHHEAAQIAEAQQHRRTDLTTEHGEDDDRPAD